MTPFIDQWKGQYDYSELASPEQSVGRSAAAVRAAGRSAGSARPAAAAVGRAAAGPGQWGAPQPQAPGQWGAPQPGQPGQSSQLGPAGSKLPSGLPAWPTWVMLGAFVLSLATSFLAVTRISLGLEGMGSLGGTINWWGVFSAETSGLGRLAEAEMQDAINAEGSNNALNIFSTILILGCYVAATVLYFLRKEKIGALLGAIGGGIQLIASIVWLAMILSEELASISAGWVMWLLFSLVMLGLSIFLLIRGSGKPKPATPQQFQPGFPQQFPQGPQGPQTPGPQGPGNFPNGPQGPQGPQTYTQPPR